jgi:hypothetical protein
MKAGRSELARRADRLHFGESQRDRRFYCSCSKCLHSTRHPTPLQFRKLRIFLRRVCAALELNHVPYMVTGSLASSVHGEPRSTNDLDVVIAPTRDQLFSLVQL